MKKCRLLTLGILLMSLLLSGCNSETDSELEEIIGNLPAAQVSDGKISFDPPVSEEENNTQYSSLTGNIVSASAKEITVKHSDSEYIFTIDADTKIFGGEIEVSKTVTVTYEGDLSDKKTAAKIVTVLTEDNSDNAASNISSEEPPTTVDTEAETEPIETSAAETTSDLETTTVTSETSDTTVEETTVSVESETLPPEETTAL